jgi:hypothetical protein
MAAAGARAADKKKQSPEDDFYGPGKIYTIRLRLTEQSWLLMQPNRRARPAPILADSIPAPTTQPKHAGTERREPRDQSAVPDSSNSKFAVEGEKLPPNNYGFEYVYVKARFELDGERLGDVGVRFKGNSSYENYNRALRRPMKVDFDHFVPKQKFRGIETFNLANNAFDTSFLRETLAYEVYRQAGVPAPRTALANVYLTVDGLYDQELVGLYTIVEEVDDKAFLKNHFGTAKGVLMKPEGVRGLPYMGENFDAYAERYRPKTHDPDPITTRLIIEFVKLVNYADDAEFRAKLADHMDVDGFLRYLAATVLIATLDSPLGNSHNYYLYVSPADGKLRLLPWDMNLSFGSWGMGGKQVNLSVAHAWPPENKLFRRIMEVDGNDEKYRAYLRDFVTRFFNRDGMADLFARLDCALCAADAAAGRTLVSGDGGRGRMFGGQRYAPAEYVPLRAASVLAQLDGNDVPAYAPRMNPPNMVFRLGLNAGQQFGVLSTMAQAIRKSGDRDGDFKLSGLEARDLAAALFRHAADQADGAASVSESQFAAALAPLLKDFTGPTPRGFLNNGRSTATATPAFLWMKAAFREADQDHDDRLTLAELTDLVDRITCTADRDQSGRLDEREIAEGLDSLAAPDGVPLPIPPPEPTRR